LVPRADMMGCQVLVSAATDFNCMLHPASVSFWHKGDISPRIA
jgi:hypothetical protein